MNKKTSFTSLAVVLHRLHLKLSKTKRFVIYHKVSVDKIPHRIADPISFPSKMTTCQNKIKDLNLYIQTH